MESGSITEREMLKEVGLVGTGALLGAHHAGRCKVRERDRPGDRAAALEKRIKAPNR